MISVFRMKRPMANFIDMPCDVPTVTARNVLLEKAAQSGAKALLFIDDDMEFLPDSYDRLNRIKADIVTGLFYTRSTPSAPTIMLRKDEGEGKFSLRSIVPDGNVQDIHACGLAFTLVRRPVILWALAESAKTGIPPFRHILFSEDMDFTNRATLAGFSAKCDTSVIIAHRGDIGFAGQPETTVPTSGHLKSPFMSAGR